MRTSLRPRVLLILAMTSAIVAVVAVACSGPAATSAKPPPAPAAAVIVATTTTTSPPAASSTSRKPNVTNATSTTATTTQTTPTTTFAATAAPVKASDVPFSWRAGCPVGPDQLRMLRLSYWGFDNQAHLGTMVVNAAVTADVTKIFARLFAQHFPIHQMQPIDVFHGSDPDSMDADNTSGFNCRYAVAPGTPQWSVHAFGEAIDVNTIENPYLEGGTVQPPAGSAFLDRAAIRPGMAVANGPLVAAFASAGWFWGGRWSSPDYQHFSKTGG